MHEEKEKNDKKWRDKIEEDFKKNSHEELHF